MDDLPVPKPIPRVVDCSECGLPWDDHGKNPTLEDCVNLLKIALAEAREAVTATVPAVVTTPYTPPYTGGIITTPTWATTTSAPLLARDATSIGNFAVTSSTLRVVADADGDIIIGTGEDDDGSAGVPAVV